MAVYTFPGGTGSILLDNLHCTGRESRLIDCPHRGVGVHDCGHSEDAGVRCVRPCKLIVTVANLVIVRMHLKDKYNTIWDLRVMNNIIP